MEMSEYDDKKKREQEVRIWLENRGFLYERYENLSAYCKTLLHNSICTPTQTVSPEQRRKLYRALCAPEAGRDYTDPVDSKTDEELRTFFSPLPRRQGRLLDDWGC